MSQTKTSSKIYPLIKSAIAGAVLPVLFMYIMIAKPDYKLMNALGHVVVPVAQWVGDVITWPIRAVGGAIDNIAQVSNLRAENEELRARLDEALMNKNTCDVAIKENQKLNQELDIVQSRPQDAIIADVIHDNRVLGHNTYIINRGAQDAIEPGMVITNTSLEMAGIVVDVAANFSRVRALTDADTNIAVRVVGSEVYGFLSGNGSSTPKMKFFSDPEFQPSAGIKLITSNISGVLPRGLYVGEMINETDVKITPPSKLSRVIVLKFDQEQKEYK